MPLQPGPELDIDQATNNNKKGAIDKGAAGGYADFQFKKCDMKEQGAGGYAVFRKSPGTAGGYADFQFKKCDMKEKGAGSYAVFRKTRNTANKANDIVEKSAIDAGGHAHFLNANSHENANTIGATNAPAPAPLATTKALT